MRQLRWNTIDASADDGTVWGELQGQGAAGDVDSEMLSALFTEKSRSKSKQKEKEEKDAGKPKGVALLDRQRAQNIEIMLRSLPRWCDQDGLACAVCNALPIPEPEPEPEPEPLVPELSRSQSYDDAPSWSDDDDEEGKEDGEQGGKEEESSQNRGPP